MIVGLDNYSDEDQLKELCSNSAVTHVMLLDPMRNRGLHRFMKALTGKAYIRLMILLKKSHEMRSILKNRHENFLKNICIFQMKALMALEISQFCHANLLMEVVRRELSSFTLHI